MDVTVEVVNGVPVARVSGEIDMSNADRVQTAVATAVGNDAYGVVLDLSDVSYLDSAGIRLLFRLDDRLRTRQQGLHVIVPSDAEINRTLEASGVIGTIAIARNEADALGAAQSYRKTLSSPDQPAPEDQHR